jgi:hypothetical protein
MVVGPLAGAGACHASSGGGEGPVDASIAPREDAGAGARDASFRPDASVARGDAAPGLDASAWDPEACAAVTIDGAYIDDNPDGCSTFKRLPCGLPPDPLKDASQLEGCLIYLGTCADLCGTGSLFCQLAPVSCDDAGAVLDASMIVDCVGACGIAGRPPRGLQPADLRSTPGAPVGDYFAAMAHLESASVRAFRDLERSLAALGAPSRLTRAARRAASDERRHARATQRLARRFGGLVSRPRVARTPDPSLAELLEDDAVHGCVGETFAALVVTWQAAHASDARVRRTMTAIARDEARHAALAWEILHWGLPQLSARDQARVGLALDTALAELVSASGTTSPEACAVAGHPARSDERRLARALATLVRAETNVGA